MLIFLLVAVAIEAMAILSVAMVVRRKGDLTRYSALSGFLLAGFLYDVAYVALRSLSMYSVIPLRFSLITYIVTYNITFLAQCVFIFVLVRDLYRHATAHLPGMESLGSLIFYGSILVSGVMALGAVASPHPAGYSAIAIVLLQLERSSCILMLCLFTFFAFTAQKLGLSYGSRVFGVTFGMSILATDRLVTTALSWANPGSRLMVDLVSEFVQIGAITLWMVYFLKAEPERRLVTVDINSPLVRWNEVAQLLGNPAGRVVVSSPSTFIPAVREVAHNAATRTGNLAPAHTETQPAIAAVR